MHGVATDVVATRREPVHPELMRSQCQILSHLYENGFAPCAHGLSTSMMAACFHDDFLAQNLSRRQHIAMMVHTHGLRLIPLSSHDGLRRTEPAEPPKSIEGESVQSLQASDNEETQAGSTESASPPPVLPSPLAGLLPFVQRMSFSSSGKLQNAPRIVWSKEEDAYVLQFFKENGASWRLMSKGLAEIVGTDRSDDALRNRHSRLCRIEANSTVASHVRASTDPPRRPWTPHEDRLIGELVSVWGDKARWRLITQQFVGRTAHSIRNRASRLYMRSERLQSANSNLPIAGECSSDVQYMDDF